MTDSHQTSTAKQALVAIQQLQNRVRELEHAGNEAIAVVGMACHFPGNINSPTEFWDALVDKKDGIIEIPQERWDVEEHFHPHMDVPGKMYTRYGGFIHNIDQFDAGFFGISPREAVLMDPQQRLLLQTVCESFDDGGFDLNHLYGSRTGVYVGISNFEYGAKGIWPLDKKRITAYSGTGGSLGVAAGRLSYVYGFTGPSMIIDTACSSSLVTTHLAIQALRNGECDIAVSAGVNLIIGPETFINFCQAHMLAPDGHCKTFSDDADGYARGEGVGAIILKRLSDAERDGDKIYAVLLGSAVNQDGPSGGLTVPNGPSQESVIKAALKNARISPNDVGYIEAHGTGTPLGDPIEISALTKVFKKDRDTKNNPLRIASVKTNLGHLESAAGIAGLIKTILCTHKAEIPPHRNFTAPNSHIDWSEFPGQINLEKVKWISEKRIGGVSSFSFSGTNAHVVVSGYEGKAPTKDTVSELGNTPKDRLLVISGHSDDHLHETRRRYLEEIKNYPDLNLQDWCTSAALGRTHHTKRTTIVASDIHQAIERLTDESLPIHSRKPGSPRIVFQYTGQGAQYTGMGKDLYDQLPKFKDAIDECDPIVHKELGISLKSILFDDEDGNFTDLIHQTVYTQPALFSYQYAYTKAMIAFGIQPDFLLGHSLGEYVAATISGVFKLEDAIKLVCARGRLIVDKCESGAMLSVSVSAEMMSQILLESALSDGVDIAAINTLEQVAVAGDSVSIQKLEQILNPMGVEFKRLNISQAFHSPLVEPMLSEYRKILSTITYNHPSIPLISNVTGTGDHDMTDPAYWITHLRNSVNYVGGIQHLINEGVDVIIEIGPKPILTAFGKLICESHQFKTQPKWISVSKKHVTSWNQFLHVIGVLYESGSAEPLKRLYAGTSRYPVDIPYTPFITESYWVEKEDKFISTNNALHPLLGSIIESPLFEKNSTVYQQQFNSDSIGFLAQHKVGGKIVMPAAAHVEIFHAAANEKSNNSIQLFDFEIHAALILPSEHTLTVQTILISTSDGSFDLKLFSKNDNSSEWKHHSSCKAIPVDLGAPPIRSISKIQNSCHVDLDVEHYYELTHRLGIEHGSTFRAISSIHSGEDLLLGKLTLQEEKIKNKFTLHPAVLDAAFQVASYALKDHESPFLPVGSDKITVWGSLPFEVNCICRYMGKTDIPNAEIYDFNVTLVDDNGSVCAEIENLRFQKISMSIFEQYDDQLSDWIYDVEWKSDTLDSNLPLRFNKIDQQSGPLAHALQDLSDNCAFYGSLFERFDHEIRDSILNTLIQLGWNPEPGVKVHIDSLKSNLGITANMDALFDRCLEIISEDNIIDWVEDTISVLAPFNSASVINKEDLIRDFKIAKPEISLLNRCLIHLGDVLTGNADPIDVLFPTNDNSSAALLYKYSVGSASINTVLTNALRAYIEQLPEFKKIRILEIGAGTGGTTSHVLPVIPAHKSEYWYTDISRHFLNMGSEKFSADYPFLKFGIFDVEKNVSEIPDGNFDIIIAANVLHATKNISEVLGHCKSRLTPGGALILLEASPRQRWLDLTFGMTDGWWRFRGNDLNRKDYPLLDFKIWKNLLIESDFTDVELIGGNNKVVTESLRQQVIVSKSDSSLTLREKPIAMITGISKSALEPIWSSMEQFIDIDQIKHLEINQLESTTKIGSIEHFIHFFQDDSSSTENIITTQHQYFSDIQRILNLLSTQIGAKNPKLWLVAKDVFATDPNTSNFANWSLSGLSRTIRTEFPEFQVTLIDPGTADRTKIGQLLAYEINAGTTEEIIRYENDQRLVQRISNTHKHEADSVVVREEATYLITGGFGPMGLMSGKYLAESGAKYVLLLGRNLPDKDLSKTLESEFKSLGAKVYFIKGDVSDESVIQSILSSSQWPPLKGIVHAAGTLLDRVLLNLDSNDLDEVMLSKILGTWLLHNATKSIDLDFFITFSSIGALLGPTAQANYAAANSWMDQLMIHRKMQGLSGLTINWGAWAGEGLANRNTGGVRTTILDSIRLIQPDQGKKSFDLLFGSGGQKVFVPFNKDSDSLKGLTLLEDIISASLSMKTTENKDIVNDFGKLSGLDLETEISKTITSMTAKILGSSPDKIDPSSGFFDLGMDSLTSIELRNALQSTFNLRLPTTLIFKYPNIETLTEYLTSELDGESRVVSDPKESNQRSNQQKDIKDLSDDELSALIDDAFNEVLGDKE